MAADRPAAGTAAAVALDSLTSNVLGLANEAHDLLRRAGRAELAARLHEEAARWREAATIVVIAGEVKRGKTSLLNLLVQRPGLLPVGHEVATAAPVLVSYSESPRAIVERWSDELEALERVEVDVDELGPYAAAPASAGIRRIELGLPAPILEGGLVLVDTPGIGSMSEGRRDLTLGVLGYADAMLFVTSAEEPLLRSETEFLALAASRIADVELVVTKTDLVADPHELLSNLALRIHDLAGVVEGSDAFGAGRLRELAARKPLPTSTLLGERAAGTEDAQRAASLAQRAGIAAVHAAIRRRVDDQLLTRLANVAQATMAGCATALRGAQVTTAPPAAEVRASLDQTLERLRRDSQRELSRALNDLETRYREQVENAHDVAAMARELPVELEAALEGAWLEVLGWVDRELRDALVAVGAGLEVELDAPGEGLPERVTQAAGREIAAPRFSPDAVDHGLPAVSQSWMLSHIFLMFLGPPGWIVAGITGAGAAAVRAFRQAKAKTRREAQAALAVAMREARSELAGALQDALTERRIALVAALDGSLPSAERPALDAGVAQPLARVARDADSIRRRLLSAG